MCGERLGYLPVRLELRPTREALLSRNGELRVVQGQILPHDGILEGSPAEVMGSQPPLLRYLVRIAGERGSYTTTFERAGGLALTQMTWYEKVITIEERQAAHIFFRYSVDAPLVIATNDAMATDLAR